MKSLPKWQRALKLVKANRKTRMPLRRTLGFPALSGDAAAQQRKQITRYINLKLVALGYRAPMSQDNGELLEMCYDLVQNYQEKMRLLAEYLCPVDRRIQDF